MAVQTVPYALQNASHSAALFRQSASAAFVSGGALSQIELAVTQQGSPNMSVILGAGRAKVVGTSVSPPAGQSFTTQAMYDTLNDAPLTLTIAASNPTNPRIDVAYIQVQDSFYSGANNQAIAGVVTGTPAPSPSVPAVPANSVAIATIAVGAGVTTIVNANISRVIQRAALLGSGFVADLDALAAVTGMATGDIREVAELAALFVYAGSSWVQMTPASFSSAAARDTAYNKASGVYKVAGRATLLRTDTGYSQYWDGTLWRYANSGLIPVIPTSATNGTIAAGGAVTFSATAGPITVNGCFTGEYDNYVVYIDQFSASTSNFLSMQLCVAGTPTTTGYDTGSVQGLNAVVSAGTTLNAANGLITNFGTEAFVRLDVRSPFAARETQVNLQFGATTNPGVAATMTMTQGLITQRATTSFDGLRIIINTGTATGRIRIYGWNNN